MIERVERDDDWFMVEEGVSGGVVDLEDNSSNTSFSFPSSSAKGESCSEADTYTPDCRKILILASKSPNLLSWREVIVNRAEKEECKRGRRKSENIPATTDDKPRITERRYVIRLRKIGIVVGSRSCWGEEVKRVGI